MSFLSLEFFLLAGATALAMHALRGPLRTIAFLAASSYFARSFLTPTGCVSTAAFCLAGFGLARAVARKPSWKMPAIACMVLAFVYMRRYSFLEPILPASLLTDVLSTAGLSFLLFKILHVIVDSASGTLGPLTLGRYLGFCLNFTTFLLGPIQRFQDFREQWDDPEKALEPRFEAHVDALNRVLRGLVKKYVLAEYVHVYALGPTADVMTMPAGEIALATFAFYAFLYFDFSGYCDIVIGVGRLMGIRPPENFNLPFLSANVSQFWMRVHRSLTVWLTSYVFNPTYAGALRNRAFHGHPLAAMSVALFVTMMVSGLWHGTTLSFILFGLVHGAYLIAFRIYEHWLTRKLGRKGLKTWRDSLLSRVLGTLLTFNVTAVAYVFFVLDGREVGRLLLRFLSP